MAAPGTRSIAYVVDSTRTVEGGGFVVRRPFPTRTLDHLDPFLLLDEMGPVVYGPGEAVGAPDHPHRGFETVTYLLDGRLQHRDSAGNAGVLGPGDVQWMTAGAGVVHAELPEDAFFRTGGRMHGFQLWVNLPRRDKLIPPRYQDVPAAQIPVVERDGVWVKVIAGAALGARAVIDTRTPIMYLHYRLQPGAQVDQPVPQDYAAFAYVVDGRGVAGASRHVVAAGQLVSFAPDGDVVSLAVPAEATAPLNLLLLGGAPLHEPVARYGPFVMNTVEEIQQAIADYRSGRMGRIGG